MSMEVLETKILRIMTSSLEQDQLLILILLMISFLEIFPTCSVAHPVQVEDLNHPLLTNQRLSPMKNAFLIMVVLLVKEVGNSLLKKKECMTFLSLS